MPARSALFLSCPGCLVLCSLVSSTAFAWGPRIHRELAGTYFTSSLLSSFADEFGTDVSAVVNGADDLDFAGDPHHEIYHGGQWLMVLNREYVYRPDNPSDWFDLDETTRLKYMMHNLGDVAVPIGHSPANQHPDAPPGTLKEAFFEGQADLGSYGSPSLVMESYAGRIIDCASQFHADCLANTDYFASNVSTGFLTVTPWSAANSAAQYAWGISQKLALAVLADYYLAKRPAAEAGADITVAPGQTATFSAAGLYDPDNIVWNTDGTYRYEETWTGIHQVRWDIGSDGSYEISGLEFSKSYDELAALFGPVASTTFTIEVLDDEGNLTYDTATLTTVPEPAMLALLGLGSAAFVLRRGTCMRRGARLHEQKQGRR